MESVERKNAPALLANLRAELLRTAQLEWETALKEYVRSSVGLERAYVASKRLMDAAESTGAPPQKADAAKAHFDRMREVGRLQLSNPRATDLQTAQVNAYAAEAELWLAQAKSARAEKEPGEKDRAVTSPQPGAAPERPRADGASSGGNARGNDAQSRRILEKLDEPLTMPFYEETTLEDVIKYIKQGTTTPSFPGIPIYVDPLGLQEADKNMSSTVRYMDLERVPLRRTLQLLLAQLDLSYFVEDGMLHITSTESAEQRSPINAKVAQAERGELTLSEMRELVEFMKARDQVRALAAEKGESHVGSGGKQPTEEAKQNHELVDLLLKETRELLEVLKATRQPKKAAEPK